MQLVIVSMFPLFLPTLIFFFGFGSSKRQDVVGSVLQCVEREGRLGLDLGLGALASEGWNGAFVSY